MESVNKAIIPIAGLATRHMPLSKVISKEFFPLADKPLIQYILEELKAAGVREVIFVVNSNKKALNDYLKKNPSLEKILEEKNEEALLEDVRAAERLGEGLSVTYVADKPLGDGHAVLQARKYIGSNEACFVVYPDDIIEAKVPCALQLANVFRTSERPVLGLFEMSKEKVSSYGVVAPEKIAHRLYKIKSMVEKPQKDAAPSNLVLTGRYIITPDVFEYLKKAKPNKKGEISLTETLGTMVKDGKIIYGHACDGKWLECGNKEEWLKSFVYAAANHPRFGKEVRTFIRTEKLT